MKIIIMISFTLLLLLAFVSSPPAPLSYDPALSNVAAFARLYGYVRYFHPSDEAAGVDWERFVLRAMPEVETAADTKELKTVLHRLFLPLAPTLKIYSRAEKAEFDAAAIRPPGQDDFKTVSWQHYGLKTNEKSPLFNSIRINRIRKGGTGGFANLMGKIDAHPYRNRRFIFMAAVKVIEGEARLWFRVDREYGVKGFSEDNKDTPLTPGGWQTVEIRGVIDRDAFMLNMGLLVEGKGSACLDHVQLLMEDGGQFVPVNIRNSGFEKDEPGKKPKYWLPQLKDFQCEVSAAEAFEGKRCALIKNLESKGPDRLFDPVLQAGEYIRKRLGGDLYCILPLVLYEKDGRTFPEADPKERVYETSIADDAPARRYQRLAAVIMAWNALRHFYPYWDSLTADWNRLLIKGLNAARKSKNQWCFLCALRRMTAGLKDGQAQVYHPVVKTRAGFGFSVAWMENHVVITASRDQSFRRGDIVLTVDGTSAVKLMARAQKFLSGSVRWKRVRALETFGWGPKDSEATVKISRAGHTMEIPVIRNNSTPVREFYRPVIHPIRGSGGKIFYIDLSKLWRGEYDKWKKTLSGADGIIFDARGPVSLKNRFIFSNLSVKPVLTPLFMAPRVLYPEGRIVHFRDQHWTVRPRPPLFKAKALFLVDNGTVSGAEALAAMALKSGSGSLAGAQTAGSGGNINTMNLPGNYRLIWTGTRMLNSDQSDLHVKGVKPHIRVERTIEGVRRGKDEVLEQAVRYFSRTNREELE